MTSLEIMKIKLVQSNTHNHLNIYIYIYQNNLKYEYEYFESRLVFLFYIVFRSNRKIYSEFVLIIFDLYIYKIFFK